MQSCVRAEQHHRNLSSAVLVYCSHSLMCELWAWAHGHWRLTIKLWTCVDLCMVRVMCVIIIDCVWSIMSMDMNCLALITCTSLVCCCGSDLLVYINPLSRGVNGSSSKSLPKYCNESQKPTKYISDWSLSIKQNFGVSSTNIIATSWCCDNVEHQELLLIPRFSPVAEQYAWCALPHIYFFLLATLQQVAEAAWHSLSFRLSRLLSCFLHNEFVLWPTYLLTPLQQTTGSQSVAVSDCAVF